MRADITTAQANLDLFSRSALMQRYALTREIKRLELQVATLASDLGVRGGSSD